MIHTIEERDFQAWLHRVDLILFELTGDTHDEADVEVLRAQWKCGYLPRTAVYETIGA